MYQLKRKKRVALYYLLDVLNNENNISTGIRLNFFYNGEAIMRLVVPMMMMIVSIVKAIVQ